MSRLLSVEALRRVEQRIPSAVWSVAIPGMIVLAMVMVLQWVPRPPLSSVARGFRPAGPSAGFALRPPRALGREGLTLRWHRVAEADGYQLRLYDSSLDEIVRYDAVVDTIRSLRLGDLAGKVAPGQILAYRIHAFHGDVEAARSEVGTCRFP